MKSVLKAFLLVTLTTAGFGCGGQDATTDPSKLTPLTDEQKKAIRAADDQVAAEENANPITAAQAKAKAAKAKND